MATQSLIWLDGVPASSLPLPDRGLDFGDGLFETLLLQQGRSLYADYHLERLDRGLQVLAFPDCVDAASEYLNSAALAVRKLGWHWSVLRLTVSRGDGPRGYAPPLEANPRIIISARELEGDCRHVQPAAALGVATVRWSSQPMLAGIKHLNRLEQVLAAAENRAQGHDESVVLNSSGLPVSVTSGNFFIMQHGQLVTPELTDCGIRGTRRRLVMEKWSSAIGLAVSEARLTLQDLYSADEIFYCNSLLGLRPVASLGDRNWHEHPVCNALFEQYRSELG